MCQIFISGRLDRATYLNSCVWAIIPGYGGGYSRIPEICTGEALRVAQFLKVMRDSGLWPKPDDSRKPRFGISDAQEMLSKVAEQSLFSSAVECAGPHHHHEPCASAWETDLAAMIKAVEDKVHAICLFCLKLDVRKPEDLCHCIVECPRKDRLEF
jgi:hypothetical protein